MNNKKELIKEVKKEFGITMQYDFDVYLGDFAAFINDNLTEHMTNDGLKLLKQYYRDLRKDEIKLP